MTHQPQRLALRNFAHIQHRGHVCNSHVVVVEFGNDSISSVSCVDCGAPQRCRSRIESGREHGAFAQVLTPDGYRCFACAYEDGWWESARDGFFEPLLGGETADPQTVA